VASLVVAASIAGLTTTVSSGTPAQEADFLTLVQRVRGDQPMPTPITFGLTTLPQEQAVMLDRSTREDVAASAPMPTPVAVDPDATPLAGPSGVGGTTTGASTRAAAPALATGPLVWPVPAGSISQYYHSGHLALDIAASYGSLVVAAQGGTVAWAGWRNNGGGYVISIDHGNGMSTVYNHLGSIWVSPGQWVGAGQGIGGVGCTGVCTGPHVHFEVIVNGVIDNPLRYF
jgi:murein DD-endopeptidase MepM/ murein hydrolase activator NlpD